MRPKRCRPATPPNRRVDPETPEEWQNIANLAEACLFVGMAKDCGLTSRAPEIDIARAEELLCAAARQGIRSQPAEVNQFMDALLFGPRV